MEITSRFQQWGSSLMPTVTNFAKRLECGAFTAAFTYAASLRTKGKFRPPESGADATAIQTLSRLSSALKFTKRLGPRRPSAAFPCTLLHQISVIHGWARICLICFTPPPSGSYRASSTKCGRSLGRSRFRPPPGSGSRFARAASCGSRRRRCARCSPPRFRPCS